MLQAAVRISGTGGQHSRAPTSMTCARLSAGACGTWRGQEVDCESCTGCCSLVAGMTHPAVEIKPCPVLGPRTAGGVTDVPWPVVRRPPIDDRTHFVCYALSVITLAFPPGSGVLQARFVDDGSGRVAPMLVLTLGSPHGRTASSCSAAATAAAIAARRVQRRRQGAGSGGKFLCPVVQVRLHSSGAPSRMARPPVQTPSTLHPALWCIMGAVGAGSIVFIISQPLELGSCQSD